ncbi:MAG: alpha/beta fold hydrolase [Klebsiella michiganensis]|nr:alpha/beta fold hydrolase [Klebsiella michiganensis]
MMRFTRLLNKSGLRLVSVAKKAIIGLLVVVIVFFIGRIYESQRGPALHRWHTWTANEMSASEIDRATFAEYQTREAAIFRDMKSSITDTLSDDEKTAINRFYAQSLVYPDKFHPDWNRSFILLPQGKPRGAAVLLHGLTDSPYSVHYLAQRYQQQGFVAVAPRLPGHGTAPGALTAVDREEWIATTRLAVREATRLAGDDAPLHVVGYSNGGALALKYALDSLEDKSLRRPQQVILLSPMIGVTAFARFAGLAGLPSVFPAFARAAWLNVVPEFNPYKYNSFPVKAARQSWLLSQALQQQIVQEAQRQRLSELAPVLTFQSVMDSTVSTRAVVDSLYRYLPDTLLPPAPRPYGTTVITNAAPDTYETVARTTLAGMRSETVTPLNIAWPQDMYSLSHVAVPFPLTDSLYGREPAEKNRYGISIGTISLRGETSTLSVGLDTLMRVTSNPFFPWMMARINHHIACSEQADIAACLRGEAEQAYEARADAQKDADAGKIERLH